MFLYESFYSVAIMLFMLKFLFIFIVYYSSFPFPLIINFIFCYYSSCALFSEFIIFFPISICISLSIPDFISILSINSLFIYFNFLFSWMISYLYILSYSCSMLSIIWFIISFYSNGLFFIHSLAVSKIVCFISFCLSSIKSLFR